MQKQAQNSWMATDREANGWADVQEAVQDDQGESTGNTSTKNALFYVGTK